MWLKTVGLVVTLALVILTAPLAAAQPPGKVPRIGLLEDSPHWEAFYQGLRDLGYTRDRISALSPT